TATPRTASWMGRPPLVSWSPRPPGSGSRCSPSPTTTGCTGCRSSRRPPRGWPTRAARSWGRCSAPSSASQARRGQGGLGGGGARHRSRGGLGGIVPPGEHSHLLVLARDAEGYRRLCAVISAAQLAGGEKGRPVYDIDALADAHGGHWVVLTGCRKGSVPA